VGLIPVKQIPVTIQDLDWFAWRSAPHPSAQG
jgi:hypothetical protein